MLADQHRLDVYWEAIGRHVHTDDLVLDLGAGSGVLSFFAAENGASVHALEHGPIIEAAKAVGRANNVQNVTFHREHSRRFRSSEKFDVLLHEQIGNAVLDEMMVENISDIRQRLLKPGGKILPNRVDMFIEPVEVRADMRTPFAWQQRIRGIDFGAMLPTARLSSSYVYKEYRPFPFGRFLTDQDPLLTIDLNSVTPKDLPNYLAYERPVNAEGIMDGFCVYFRASFDDDLSFTSSPALPVTNWAVPLLRVAPRTVQPGELIRLDLEAENLSLPKTWRWNLQVAGGNHQVVGTQSWDERPPLASLGATLDSGANTQEE
jgi:type I protein arginine methyltransferase